MSFDQLIEKIIACKNPTVLGLDSKLEYIPAHIRAQAIETKGKGLAGAAEAQFLFNKGLMDELVDIIPAVKPQCAYYEMYGWQGMEALARTIAYAREKGFYVIADGKRNDIGSTMEAYASAWLGETEVEGEKFEAFGADALTVNGYFGSDGITPLLKLCKERNKGIFVLVKTSNPSSGELQNLSLEKGFVYEQMGHLCEHWGEGLGGRHGYNAVGAVVGATYPEELADLRTLLPHTFFLVPGYGAQGGGGESVKGGFDKNGLGAVVNSSRAILCAWQHAKSDGRDYLDHARREALRMRDEINAAIGRMPNPTV